jgi:hypothetical protein
MVGEGITGPQEKVRRSIGESGGKSLFFGNFIVLFLLELIYFKLIEIVLFEEMGWKPIVGKGLIGFIISSC